MAVPLHEQKLIIQLRRMGGHPTLISEFIHRDPRVVKDIIDAELITRPPTHLPKTTPDHRIRKLARQHLSDPSAPLIQFLNAIGDKSPASLNLMLQAITLERQLACTTQPEEPS